MIDLIMKKMKQIDYGWVDNKGNIHKDDDIDFSLEYILQTPNEILDNKVGVCWDQVELERKMFDENKILNETYFIFIDDKFNLPSHTFLVYYLNDRVYWFEHSWYDERGIHEYNSINELLNDVKNKFYKSREKEVIPNLDVHIYKYNKPKFHITCDDFYKYIYTQKKIYINDIK